MDSVTHLTGSVVKVGDRMLQRCIICGEKLVDNYGVPVPLGPDGKEEEFPTWEPGVLLRLMTTNSGSRFWQPLNHSEKQLPDELPDDSCIALVE